MPFRLPSLDGRTTSSAFTDTDDTRLGRSIAPLAAAHPGLSGIYPLLDAQDAFAARMLLARAAERSLDIQYYIWHADLSGTLLFEAIREAADRGVRVRLLLDDNNTAGLDPVLAALDAHPRIEVRLFNPFVLRSPRLIGYLTNPLRLNRRMHNKSFTVDNQVTVIGGRNIGDEYFGVHDGALFIDLDVLAAGPVVRDVSDDFDRYWSCASAYPIDRLVPAAEQTRLSGITSRASLIEHDPKAREYIDAVHHSPFVAQLLHSELPFEWVPVQMLSDDPAKGLGLAPKEKLLLNKLQQVFGEPRQTLGLVSGYFVPTRAGVQAFTELARRGVYIHIMTNALSATDIGIVHAGYAKRRKPLLRAGISLYEMRRPPQDGRPRRRRRRGSGSGSLLRRSGSTLHAKTFTVDGERVFVGSFNFDPRSFHLNTELGFLIRSPTLAQQIERAFEELIPENAYEVRLSERGELYWIERDKDFTIRHQHEPESSRLRRAGITLLSWLPIEWLL